jgi:hypothetical protein
VGHLTINPAHRTNRTVASCSDLAPKAGASPPVKDPWHNKDGAPPVVRTCGGVPLGGGQRLAQTDSYANSLTYVTDENNRQVLVSAVAPVTVYSYSAHPLDGHSNDFRTHIEKYYVHADIVLQFPNGRLSGVIRAGSHTGGPKS